MVAIATMERRILLIAAAVALSAPLEGSPFACWAFQTGRRANKSPSTKTVDLFDVVGRLIGSSSSAPPAAAAAPSKWLTRVSMTRPEQANVEESDEQRLDDNAIQWELFNKYHNKGSWKGIWTTYDYMGDISLETIASVDYKQQQQQQRRQQPNENDASSSAVDVSHTIVVSATKSDCATCFDDMETRTIPVAQYTPDNFSVRKTRLGACGMVVGPSLLKNGASTYYITMLD